MTAILAGSSARTLSAIAIAPLELVRTKMMARTNPPSMIQISLNQARTSGIRSFWTGLSSTLLRDAPFSALYWLTAENARVTIRQSVFGKTEQQAGSVEEFCVSFISGSLGGFIAALFTHPFDVVKTRRQIIDYSVDVNDIFKNEKGSFATLRRILRQEGFVGLYVGCAPRLGKIVPACAIMLSSYEAGKKWFSLHDHRLM